MMYKTAGQLSQEALKDNIKYDAREVGHAMTDDIGKQFRQCIENHKSIINEPEFCVIMIVAEDPMIKNLKRRKFYAWPYMPSPRPNQAVFLYNRAKDDLTKRLWILPSAMVMAELCSLSTVDLKYLTMKKWSEAFFHGWVWNEERCKWINTRPSHFFKVIRDQHKINMQSEHEYILSHREELLKAGCKVPDSTFSDPFDFSKITIKQVVDSNNSCIQ